MILDKTVETTLNAANFKHFKMLGYSNFKCGDKLIIPVEHLNKGSHLIIKVKCDECGKEKDVVYKDYLKTTRKYNFYTCSNCFNIKVKKTNLQNHNDENYCNMEKIKKTNLSNYGVENPMQIRKFFEKQQKKSYLLKKHDKLELYYRGTYEKDFLDFCYNNKIKIEKGKRFEYLIDNQKHYYFSDFYIKSHNLIVEIKSDWTYNNNLEINKLKEKSVLNSGYDYLFLIDKDYNEFKDKLKNKLNI